MGNPRTPIQAILFDLDGTLVDSLGATFEAFNIGIQSQGGKPLKPKEILAHFGPGETEIFAKILGRDRAAGAYGAARTYMQENMGRVPLHPGVDELLIKIRESGVPTSIITGRNWETTELILKHHGILDLFKTVIANDHVSQPKPSPEGLLLAMARHGLQPEETIYVGDSPADVLAARSSGAQAVAAVWDLLATREKLSPYEPHHYAEHPADVWKLWLGLST